MGVSVGIDLGTTFSAVAVLNRETNKPFIIPNEWGNKITPSVIQFIKDNNGEIKTIVGDDAKDAFDMGGYGCVSAFKRLMGTNKECFWFDGKEYDSIELSTIVLEYLKDYTEKYLGDEIDEAVITVPAYFYSREREATKVAAEKAGINVKKIIDEPNAAVLAFGLEHWKNNANILIYDLGGGTFDVTLTHMEKDGCLNTLVTKGDHFLGGKDWDERIVNIARQKILDETEYDLNNDEKFLKEIKGLAEGIKKKLSLLDVVTEKILVPGYGSFLLTLSIKEFDDNTIDLLSKTGSLCNNVLNEAHVSWGEVTDIILVGGSTRMRQVSTFLKQISGGKTPLSQVNPDEAVALGAAIQASKNDDYKYYDLSYTIDEGKRITDRDKYGFDRSGKVGEDKIMDVGMLTLLETTAHAMGVIAYNDDEKTLYNEIIIPANHPRPVKAAKKFRFYTSEKDTNELIIYVVQGDNQDPLDIECQITGKYIVSGIKHVNRGDKIGTIIRIQYSYDKNGIICIQARQENSDEDLPISFEKYEDCLIDIETLQKKYMMLETNNLSRNINKGQIVHKYQPVTFDDVGWELFDNVSFHSPAINYNEPKIHVEASNKNIAFHGYNISQMNEGVRYTIASDDDFEISCNIDTSTIKPHPGGHLLISLGDLSASLDEHGGNIMFGGKNVFSVGSTFALEMSLREGNYIVKIDSNEVVNEKKQIMGAVDIEFCFQHDAHNCSSLSHAYVNNINMMHKCGDMDDVETPTW